jgi:hypothetical protein
LVTRENVRVSAPVERDRRGGYRGPEPPLAGVDVVERAVGGVTRGRDTDGRRLRDGSGTFAAADGATVASPGTPSVGTILTGRSRRTFGVRIVRLAGCHER